MEWAGINTTDPGIKLVNLKHHPEAHYDVYIGRENEHRGLPASKWANPYPMANEANRPMVLARYELYLETRFDLLLALGELGGKTLACWCVNPDPHYRKVCHGHILVKLYRKHVLGLPVPAEHGVVDEAILATPIGH